MKLKAIICAYCNINESSYSEHVFPYSLGGENIFMDCVCDECNNNFSTLERELLQKSMIGMMRSYEGIEGYSKGKHRTAPLKYPEMFQFVKKDKAVYEIGLYQGFKPFMRPQIIHVDGNFYAEGPSIEEMKIFIEEFNKWRNKNLTMIIKFPQKKGEHYKGIKYETKNGEYCLYEIDMKNDKKAVIHYELMKDNSEYHEYFEPRIFLDDSKRLIVRSRKVNEGTSFMKSLLDYCAFGSSHFKSFSQEKSKEAIKISMQFDVVKMQQALVKIGLNSLMHYYPETKYSDLLTPAKEFVLNEVPLKTVIDQKIELLDTNPKLHTILFHQLEKGLLLRTSLFGGGFVYSTLIENLKLFPSHGQFSAVEIDFKERKQSHLGMDDFLINKLTDLGWIDGLIRNAEI